MGAGKNGDGLVSAAASPCIPLDFSSLWTAPDSFPGERRLVETGLPGDRGGLEQDTPPGVTVAAGGDGREAVRTEGWLEPAKLISKQSFLLL